MKQTINFNIAPTLLTGLYIGTILIKSNDGFLYIVRKVVRKGEDYIVMNMHTGEEMELVIGTNSKSFKKFYGTITVS